MPVRQKSASLIIAWCTQSQEFMNEYNAVASHLYKMGELTQDIFLTKIDGDKEKSLS
jgi:hypothetical protein